MKGSTRERARARTPINASSRRSGTPSIVRNLPICCPSAQVYSASFAASSMCTTRRSIATRPVIDPRPGANVWPSMNALNSGKYPNAVAARYALDCQGAEQSVVVNRIHIHETAGTTQVDDRAPDWIARPVGLVVRRIYDYDQPFAAQHSAEWIIGVRTHRRAQKFSIGLRDSARRDEVQQLAMGYSEMAASRVAKPRRPFQHRIEHRGKVSR